MSAATLSALLPAPSARVDEYSDDGSASEGEQAAPAPLAVATTSAPPYGRRANWKPRKQEDFGDGGAYPECHIAQYPLEMGRKKSVSRSAGLAACCRG